MGADPVTPPGAATNRALARGLYVLRRLVESGPMSATEVARELGLHQSSISRVMSTLIEAGFVRKDAHGRFTPDYGVITLAAETTRLPLLTTPVPVFTALLAEYPTLTLTTAMLWRSEMIYLVRSDTGGMAHLYESLRFPLHRSSPALRLLLDLPEPDALALLAGSRERFGWSGDPAIVPPDERAVLARARDLLHHDVLVLEGWANPGEVSAAIPVRTTEPHPVALAIVVSDDSLDAEELLIVLHRARRDLEAAFHP